MNFDDIETFLAIVEYTNIARAANRLNIGQGTASSRIRHMEDELGIQLFFRQKGIKTVTLTPEGEYFLTIAQQWLSLWRQAQQIKNRLVFQELRIAAVDTLNRFHFVNVYKEFMKSNPNIKFFLQTEHSTEIHQLIENQQIDIGFVFSLHKSPNVVSFPLFRENIVVIYHKGMVFHQTHHLSDLKTDHEIYQTMGADYDLWHRRRFPQSDMKKISIGTASMLPSFIDEANTWTLAPQTLADILTAQDKTLAYAAIDEDPPPARTAYMLLYKYPKLWIRELSNLFMEEVVKMILATPSLQLLYE